MGRSPVLIYEELRARILKGAIGGGERLREGSLASELGVSRTPVREALRRLQSDGLVELTPNRGARVANVSDADIDDTYALRAVLEGQAARLTAENGFEDIDRLSVLCDDMEAELRRLDERAYGTITKHNLDLHRTIHEASRNKALMAALSGVIQVGLVRHTFDHYRRDELRRSFAQHRELIDAIAARDGAWAESVMVSHILSARASLRQRVRTSMAETDRYGDAS